MWIIRELKRNSIWLIMLVSPNIVTRKVQISKIESTRLWSVSQQGLTRKCLLAVIVQTIWVLTIWVSSKLADLNLIANINKTSRSIFLRKWVNLRLRRRTKSCWNLKKRKWIFLRSWVSRGLKRRSRSCLVKKHRIIILFLKICLRFRVIIYLNRKAARNHHLSDLIKIYSSYQIVDMNLII